MSHDRPPTWDDLDGLRGLPCAVVVGLPDGSAVAIHGRAERVERYAQRDEPDQYTGAQWDGMEPMAMGVRVKWHQGYRMTWSDAPPPAVDTPSVEPGRPAVIERESIEDAQENDRCGICGSAGHFRELCPDAVVWTQDKCRPIVYARAGLGDPNAAVCEKCGSTGRLSMHHRRKRGQGGTWAPSNIVVLCGDGTTGCHGWVEGNSTSANAEGWHLTAGDPAGSIVPIRHWRIKWARVQLDDDGCLNPIPW